MAATCLCVSHHRYLDRKGIDVGQIDLIVYAQTLQGKR